MEANEMKPGTRDERREALEEFQRRHDEMGGAIAIRGFELEDDLAGPGAAEPFVAQGRTCDVAAQAFEFLPLLGPAAGVGMQTEPLSLYTPLGMRALWARRAQRGVFPRQHFLSCPGAEGNAVSAGGRVQRSQGRIGIRVGQVRESLFFDERACAGQAFQHPLHDSREDGLKLFSGGSRHGLEKRDAIREAIDAIEH